MKTAETRLSRRPSGTFLLRISADLPNNPFTLSCQQRDEEHRYICASHHRLLYAPSGGYTIGTKEGRHGPFDTVEKVIEACYNLLNLKGACPKRKLDRRIYSKIYRKNTFNGTLWEEIELKTKERRKLLEAFCTQ